MHSAWIGEHHLNYFGVNSSPQVMLAMLAGATTRIRLAPAVVLLPIHHPLHVAEDWATLDLLSGGRVDFAAGRGYDRAEYAAFGAPFDDSAAIFAEGLEIIWRAWTETGRWSHRGRHYQFADVDIVPNRSRSRCARMSPASRGPAWNSARRTIGISSMRRSRPRWLMAALPPESPRTKMNARSMAANAAASYAASMSTYAPAPAMIVTDASAS